jgi:hypothetical protein
VNNSLTSLSPGIISPNVNNSLASLSPGIININNSSNMDVSLQNIEKLKTKIQMQSPNFSNNYHFKPSNSNITDVNFNSITYKNKNSDIKRTAQEGKVDDEIQRFVDDFLMDAFLTSKEIDLEHHKDLLTAPAFDSESSFDQYGISNFIKRQNSLIEKNKLINNDMSSNIISLGKIAEKENTLKKLDQAFKRNNNQNLSQNGTISSLKYDISSNKIRNNHHHHHHHSYSSSPAAFLNKSNLLNDLLKGKSYLTSSSPSEFKLNNDNSGITKTILKNEYQNSSFQLNKSPNQNQYLSPLVKVFNNRILSPLEDEKNPVLSPMGFNAAMFLASNSLNSSSSSSYNLTKIQNKRKISVPSLSSTSSTNIINSPYNTTPIPTLNNTRNNVNANILKSASFDNISEIIYNNSPNINILQSIGDKQLSNSPVSENIDLMNRKNSIQSLTKISSLSNSQNQSQNSISSLNNNLLNVPAKKMSPYLDTLEYNVKKSNSLQLTSSGINSRIVNSSSSFPSINNTNSFLENNNNSLINKISDKENIVSSPQQDLLLNTDDPTSPSFGIESNVKIINSLLLKEYNNYILNQSKQSSKTKKTPSIILTPSAPNLNNSIDSKYDSLILPSRELDDQKEDILNINTSLQQNNDDKEMNVTNNVNNYRNNSNNSNDNVTSTINNKISNTIPTVNQNNFYNTSFTLKDKNRVVINNSQNLDKDIIEVNISPKINNITINETKTETETRLINNNISNISNDNEKLNIDSSKDSITNNNDNKDSNKDKTNLQNRIESPSLILSKNQIKSKNDSELLESKPSTSHSDNQKKIEKENNLTEEKSSITSQKINKKRTNNKNEKFKKRTTKRRKVNDENILKQNTFESKISLDKTTEVNDDNNNTENKNENSKNNNNNNISNITVEANLNDNINNIHSNDNNLDKSLIENSNNTENELSNTTKNKMVIKEGKEKAIDEQKLNDSEKITKPKRSRKRKTKENNNNEIRKTINKKLKLEEHIEIDGDSDSSKVVNVKKEMNSNENHNSEKTVDTKDKDKQINIYNGRVTKNPRIFECKFKGCNKAFTKAHNLRSHERSHMNDRPYSCKYCEKSFVRQYDLLRHERIHTGVKPYVCKKCFAAFSRNDAYNKHIRSCLNEDK